MIAAGKTPGVHASCLGKLRITTQLFNPMIPIDLVLVLQHFVIEKEKVTVDIGTYGRETSIALQSKLDHSWSPGAQKNCGFSMRAKVFFSIEGDPWVAKM